jgi:hypothetical protein
MHDPCRGETAGAAVLPFFPSPTVMAPAPVSAESLRQLGRRPPPAAHCPWPSDQKKRPPWGGAWRLRSEGDQTLQCRINHHQRLSRLLLEQHLGRQLSQPGIVSTDIENCTTSDTEK